MIVAFGNRCSRKRYETTHIHAVRSLTEYPFACALQTFAAFARQAQDNAGLELDSQFLAPSQDLRILFDGRALVDIRLDSIIGALHTRQDFDQTAFGHLAQIFTSPLMGDNIRPEKATPDEIVL